MQKYLLILLFLIIVRPGYALQSTAPKYHLRQFTDENGLPQNSVQDIALGNYGFLWITTQGGLVRFDGQQMVTYTRKDLSVNSDRYVAVGFNLEAGSGIMTAVTEHRQLVRIDGGTAFRDKRSLYEQTAGLRLIQSQVQAKGMRFDTARNKQNYLQYRIVTASPDRYYLYADQKVAFFENGKLTGMIPFPGTPSFAPFPYEPRAWKDAVAKARHLICQENFMSISGSLFYHQGAQGTLLQKLSKEGIAPMYLRGDIEQNPAYAAGKGQVRIITNRFKGQAFAYLNGSIYQIHYRKQTQSLQTKLLIEGLDIEEKLIHRMLYDEGNGTLFLGSVSQGLFIARPSRFQVAGLGQSNDLNSFFYAQLPYTDSSVIIPEGFEVSSSRVRPAGEQFLGASDRLYRYGMLRDRDGGIWGIEPKAFFRVLPKSKERKDWRLELQPERLYQGMGNVVWVGYRTGELAYLDYQADTSQKPRVVAKFGNRCTFLHQDRPGRLWVGTNSGLYLYDSLRQAAYPVKALARKDIRSIFHTRPDELWITTYGDGIFLLKENRLYKMPLDDKNYLAYAHCILKDSNGYFWISTNKGLFRTSLQDMLDYAAGKLRHVFYLYYNKNDGFLTNEFNGGCQPCGIRLADGRLSFPSMNGLVWFKPEPIGLPDLNTPIRLERFVLDEQKLDVVDTLSLPYDFKHFSMHPSGAYMGNPDDVEYFYSMHKSATDTLRWTRVAHGQPIDVYQMGAGTYTLVVRQTTGFGGKYVETKLVLIVESPWFLSWWFILLVLASLGLIFWLGLKWRVQNLVRQNESLARKVEERTLHLSETLEELRASDEALQTQLQIQMRIIGAINHDLHAPLRFLSIHVPRYLQQVSSRPDHPETTQLGSSISKSTLKVYALADELLGFIKATYNKKGKVVYEKVPIREILDKKVLFFSEMAHENQVVFELTCPPGLTVTTNRVMAEILVHNLIDNALKHTYAQSVRLMAGRDAEDNVEISISDSGFGMEASICDWLNYNVGAAGTDLSNPPQPPSNLGLGLIMVREISTLLGIYIKAASTREGTTITLVFSE